jgi:predicted  nucleic acid-binding Zn-ribbon protein
MSKNHATILHSLKNFDNDISPYDMNRKVYDKCVEVFDSLAEVYTSIDERDIEIDSLKNKIIDLQLQLKEVRPYSSDIEVLVNLIKKIPKEHIDTAEFRIKTLLKGFTIEPRNQKTEIISAFEGVTSF